MTLRHLSYLQNFQKQICATLAVLAIALFVSYVYFISASVVHVVIRTETTQELKKVGSEIALLESRFIEAQNQVSVEIASLQGYTETSKKVFINRSAPAFVLSDGSFR